MCEIIGPDAALTVQASERLAAVNQASTGPQSTPQLVEHDKVGERMRDVHGAEPGRPAGEQNRRLHVGVGVDDSRDIVDDGTVPQCQRLPVAGHPCGPPPLVAAYSMSTAAGLSSSGCGPIDTKPRAGVQ